MIPRLFRKAPAPRTYAQLLLSFGTPLVYWPCNDTVGSSTIADTSGNGRTATIVNTTTLGGASKNSRLSTMAACNATSYWTVASSVAFRHLGDATWLWWMRLNSALTSGQLIPVWNCSATGEASAENHCYYIGIQNLSGVHNTICFHESGSGTNRSTPIPITYTPTNWNFFAIVRDTTALTYTAYVNGALAGSGGSYTANPSGGGSTTFNMGRDVSVPSNSAVARDLDELAFFTSMLTAANIKELYRAGKRAA